MKRTMAWVVVALVMGAPLASAAAPAAVVEAVQYPAWLERNGNAVPLSPGTALQASDRIRTGGNARVRLKLGEGSAVKLGENARFAIERAEDRGVFTAALNVIAGAFRFTTDEQRKPQAREIAIQVKNVTAGIRGTDLWGKSTGERDLVCLLEGRIAVGSKGRPEATLDQPGAFYALAPGGEPQLARADRRQIEEWARETEIAPDGPAAEPGGTWRVVAAVVPTRDAALRLNRALRAAGFPAEIVRKDGFIAVQLPYLSGEAQARAAMAALRTVPGVEMPTVHPMPPARP